MTKRGAQNKIKEDSTHECVNKMHIHIYVHECVCVMKFQKTEN